MRSQDLTTYENGAHLATFEVTFFVEDVEKLKAKFAKTELASVIAGEVDEDGNPYPFNSAQAILELLLESIDEEELGISMDGSSSSPDLIVSHG
jgi:hypothetical protein